MNEEELNKAAEEAAREVYTYTFQGMDDLIGLFKAGAKWGYQQAEKDLQWEVNHREEAYMKGVQDGLKERLTWEDIETINQLTSEVCSEFFGDPCGFEDFDREKTYTEVLRRFNERKK